MSPLRQKRRRTRIVRLSIFVVMSGLAAFALHTVSYLPQFSINTITVTGTRTLSPDLIRADVESRVHDGMRHFISPSNIFFYDRDGIIGGLRDDFLRIKQVAISRPSPFSTELIVAISERTPYAMWCTDAEANCFHMDDTGFIFDTFTGSSTASGLVIFQGGMSTSSVIVGNYVARTHFGGIAALLTLLGQAGFAAQAVHIDDEDSISITLSQGFIVRTAFGADAPGVVRNLQLILSAPELANKTGNLEYVDLRFGNRVYYKLKGSERASTTPQVLPQ